MQAQTRWLAFGWPVLTGLLLGFLILQQQTPEPITAGLSYASAVERAAPAVVNIFTARVVPERPHPLLDDPLFRQFFESRDRGQRSRIERSRGSGVIVSSHGYILTNHHVINGADEILVQLHDGREGLAYVIGSDADTDLAVLQIEMSPLTPIEFADADQARVGDVVLAIGNPFGLGHSVSQGIISAIGRYGLRLNTYENFIQTDAAINQGNSGGALVDLQGRLLGINAAILTQNGGSVGIGLAIPINLAQQTMDDLLTYGVVVRGWLGLEVQPLTEALAQQRGLEGGNGVIVTALAQGGPAQQAGLRPGDLITHINGTPVGDGHMGMNVIAQTRPGEAVLIEGRRSQGEPFTLHATVSTRPSTR